MANHDNNKNNKENRMTWINILVAASFLSAVFGAAIPAEWQGKVDSFNAFFGEDDSGKLVMDGFPDGVYLVMFIVLALHVNSLIILFLVLLAIDW
jgi:hypothetical protein